jgi:hypothetical protein
MKKTRIWLCRIAGILLLIPATGLITGAAQSAFDYCFAVACILGSIGLLYHAHILNKEGGQK